jgi:hypothetical protein
MLVSHPESVSANAQLALLVGETVKKGERKTTNIRTE